MDTSPAPTLERQLAATLDWWREAGVDHVFADEPRGWLDQAGVAAPASVPADGPAAEPAGAMSERPPSIGGPPEAWPRDLAGFRAWWLAEPSLELGGTGPRLAPRGEAGAELMVLVPTPDATDRDTLLSGREGQLVANMIAAMGIAPDAAYVATALPRHMAQPDWEGLDQAGLGAILRHHIALVKPKRLLVLGRFILPLLGHDRTQAPAAIGKTSIQGASGTITVPTLVGFAPDRLLANARQRAMLWRQWLDWTESHE